VRGASRIEIMPPEARLEHVGTGLTPVSDGWFVVNAREAAWVRHDTFGLRCPFETNGPVARGAKGVEERTFPQLGFHLAVLEPGRPSSLYHAEESQEDFLVVSGECIVVIEEEERRLRAWDFVHCPPGTRHVFVGAGDRPCILVLVGSRFGERGIRYPASAAADAHGAAVEVETDSAKEAYDPFGSWRNEGPANPAGL
jgi:uncharacterized cupin superfamily protein